MLFLFGNRGVNRMMNKEKGKLVFDLTGKVTLITGGQRGLGKTFSEGVSQLSLFQVPLQQTLIFFSIIVIFQNFINEGVYICNLILNRYKKFIDTSAPGELPLFFPVF